VRAPGADEEREEGGDGLYPARWTECGAAHGGVWLVIWWPFSDLLICDSVYIYLRLWKPTFARSDFGVLSWSSDWILGENGI
jgi:hypothetical protein